MPGIENSPFRWEKIWPHLWGHVFKRLRSWWAMSGKAIQGAVPPARTTIWEVTHKIFESEGHVRVCGLFVTRGRSTCRAKTARNRVWGHSCRNFMNSKALPLPIAGCAEPPAISAGWNRVKKNAHRLHAVSGIRKDLVPVSAACQAIMRGAFLTGQFCPQPVATKSTSKPRRRAAGQYAGQGRSIRVMPRAECHRPPGPRTALWLLVITQ